MAEDEVDESDIDDFEVNMVFIDVNICFWHLVSDLFCFKQSFSCTKLFDSCRTWTT